jgi:antitoxin ParD1/3/4
MTIHADLGPQLEAFVSELIASGRYRSPDEVLREALRLFQERETELAALDAAIERGLADADAGRVTPAAEVFDELERLYPVLAATDPR